MSAQEFRGGEMLSYSAGSTQTGPDGFRKVDRNGLPLCGLLQRLFPSVAASFAGRLPLVLNAYPASVGFPTDGLLVDCYLSFRTASRALQLAAREQMPVLILGQSLYIAELLHRHCALGFALPDSLVALVGGYYTPQSLERAMQTWLAGRGVRISFVHGYGAAEVEAGMLLATERSADGSLRYFPRGADIAISLVEGRLHLALKTPDGSLRAAPFDTGDLASADGEAWIIRNAESRLSAQVITALESWTPEDWQRRTGYLSRKGEALTPQLRESCTAAHAGERHFYDYCAAHGMAWLEKPRWG